MAEEVFDEQMIDEPVQMLDPEDLHRKSHGDFPAFGDLVVMVLIILGSQLVVALVSSLLGVGVPQSQVIESVDLDSYMGVEITRGERFAVIYPLSMALAFGLLLLYVRKRDGKGVVARFSRNGFNPNIILSGLIWLVASQILLEPLLELLPDTGNGGTGRGFWALMTAVLFAPFFEELICRGVILETLRRRWGKRVSVVMSALFFAIIHLQPATAITALVAGLIFGTVYLRTQSLFSTIILHSLNNAIAFALIAFGLDEMSFGELFGGGVRYWGVYAVSAFVCLAIGVESYRKVYRKQ
ncbi:MAG: CPBP family intramembrane metalloprotease [Alistipes sp.]|nr:CPBP family intramembrane metalloprotease [Alistipes sp.]